MDQFKNDVKNSYSFIRVVNFEINFSIYNHPLHLFIHNFSHNYDQRITLIENLYFILDYYQIQVNIRKFIIRLCVTIDDTDDKLITKIKYKLLIISMEIAIIIFKQLKAIF